LAAEHIGAVVHIDGRSTARTRGFVHRPVHTFRHRLIHRLSTSAYLGCLARQLSGPAQGGGVVKDPLTVLPSIGVSLAGDLRQLGVKSVKDLARRDPE